MNIIQSYSVFDFFFWILSLLQWFFIPRFYFYSVWVIMCLNLPINSDKVKLIVIVISSWASYRQSFLGELFICNIYSYLYTTAFIVFSCNLLFLFFRLVHIFIWMIYHQIYIITPFTWSVTFINRFITWYYWQRWYTPKALIITIYVFQIIWLWFSNVIFYLFILP